MRASSVAALKAIHAGLDFGADVMDFIDRGNVYCTGTAFILWHVENDTLFIYLAAGDISEFLTIPHPKTKWIAFQRRGKSRRYLAQSLKSKFHGRTKTTETDSSAPAGA